MKPHARMTVVCLLRVIRLPKRGQATTELAIFGSIFLLVLGALLSLGQNINHQIDTEVDAYIMALQNAQSADGPVSYVVLRDKRLANTQEGFKELSRTAFSGSATVLWLKLLTQPKIKPHVYYQINDDEPIDMRQDAWKKDFPGKDDDGDGQVDEEPGDEEDGDFSYPSVWDIETTVNTDYKGKTNTATNATEIKTTKEATLRESIARVFKMRYYNREQGIEEDFTPPNNGDKVRQNIYPRDDGRTVGYKKVGGGVKWQRTITTAK